MPECSLVQNIIPCFLTFSSRPNIKEEKAVWLARLPPLPLLCEISGALHLAQLGLTAGRW